ncbi:MAG: mechanosensitive ion channel family protein [Candidatus Sumerlaeia bacterium]|nr:mechanosensitive ion channel family protein [Candidatus Sumerlaeia bacterium]
MLMSRPLPLLVLLLLLLGTLVATPQGSQAQEATADGSSAAVPVERANARATLRTFLRGWAEADEANSADRPLVIRRIVETLDLSELPSHSRNDLGETLAYLLKTEVLDKHALINYERISDDPSAPPHVVLVSPSGLRVVVGPDERGDWRFTRETVRNIQSIATEFAGRGTVAGVYSVEHLKPPAVALRDALPNWMTKPALVLYVYQWIGLAVLAVLVLVIGRALVYLALALFGRRLTATGLVTEADARYIFNWPLGVVLSMGLWWAFDGWLGLPPPAMRITDVITTLVFGVAAIVMLNRFINVAADRLMVLAGRTETKFDDLLVPFARKSAKIVVTLVGILMILDNLGMDLKTALGTLAIGGLAVSLAAKDTVSNLFGTITIIGDSPFQIGDWIAVDNVEGTVESLGFRSTRVRTFYNSLVTIPNANLISAVVDNYGMRRYRRYMTHLSIAYSTPTDRMEEFCEGIRELIRQHPYTRKDFYFVYFHQYGPHSLDILLYMFFQVPDWGTELRERHRLNADIHRLAKQLGVEFAFPTQTLHLLRGQAETHPDGTPVSDAEAIAGALERSRATVSDIVGRTLGPPGVLPPTVNFAHPHTLAPQMPGAPKAP